MKPSPAPSVSTTLAGSILVVHTTPASSARAPFAPRVMTTSSGPCAATFIAKAEQSASPSSAADKKAMLDALPNHVYRMAAKAYASTAAYDAAIANWFA